MEEILADISSGTSVPLQVIAARLVGAALFGAVIGIDRQMKSRPAGLRTHVLVSVASAIFAILTIEIVQSPTFAGDEVRADPLRIVGAVTSGVAFLAAGFIIFAQGKVHGVTTGAGVWLASSIGLASGLGHWGIALLGTAAGLIVMIVLRWIEVDLHLKDEASGRIIEGD